MKTKESKRNMPAAQPRTLAELVERKRGRALMHLTNKFIKALVKMEAEAAPRCGCPLCGYLQRCVHLANRLHRCS
jgi:hypothetical protein